MRRRVVKLGCDLDGLNGGEDNLGAVRVVHEIISDHRQKPTGKTNHAETRASRGSS